jgi:peptide/nickel transport system permease protein
MMLLPYVPLLILIMLGPLDAATSSSIWLPSTPAHLLGTDEFGRDAILVLLISVGRSLLSGILLAGISIVVSTLVAYAVALRRIRLASIALRALVQIVESIPTFVWVLAAFAALSGSSTLIIGIVFTLAVLPAVSNILAGEFSRLNQEAFIESARLLGVGEMRLLRRHILPNALPVLAPMFIQILGTAIAIKGAIGLMGFSNRSEYDLGIILIRAKENIISHPQLMASTIAAIALIYVYLDWLRRRLTSKGTQHLDLIKADAMLR